MRLCQEPWILAEQNHRFALRYADRAYLIKKGAVRHEAPADNSKAARRCTAIWASDSLRSGTMGPADKLQAAFELHEAGVALMRQNLRRRHPDASQERIEELLTAWLRTRPGAEYGDAVGHPAPDCVTYRMADGA